MLGLTNNDSSNGGKGDTITDDDDDKPKGSISIDPLIVSLSPLSGVAGTVVTISGQDLKGPKETEVYFASTQALILSASPTQLVVQAPSIPPNSSLSVPITVKIGDNSFILQDAFQYLLTSLCVDGPEIANLNPKEGTLGETVTVTGKNFESTTIVSIGVLAGSTFLSASAISLSVPNLNSQCVENECDFDVIVQNDNGCSDVLENGFTYKRDSDSDGISDADEQALCGTDIGLADTDGDGLIDSFECFQSTGDCDPLNADSDGDGTKDGDEWNKFGSCTLNNDFDEDGYSNYNACTDELDCDCNDNDPDINPGAPDPLDGVDRNCRLDKPRCDPDPEIADTYGAVPSYNICDFSTDPNYGIVLSGAGSLALWNYVCAQAIIEEPLGPGYWLNKDLSFYFRTARYFFNSNYSGRFAYELDENLPTTTTQSGSASSLFPVCAPPAEPFAKSDLFSIGQTQESQESMSYNFPGTQALADNNSTCDFDDLEPIQDQNPIATDNFIEVEQINGSLKHRLRVRISKYFPIANQFNNFKQWVLWDVEDKSCYFGD